MELLDNNDNDYDNNNDGIRIKKLENELHLECKFIINLKRASLMWQNDILMKW